jgi:hypothetical protein
MSCPVLQHGEVIPQETRSLISTRCRTVTRAINQEFRNSDSETANSLYVGSYGHGTVIWKWTPSGETFSAKPGDYERVLLNYFVKNINLLLSLNLTAPGSGLSVEASSSLVCLGKVVKYIAE